MVLPRERRYDGGADLDDVGRVHRGASARVHTRCTVDTALVRYHVCANNSCDGTADMPLPPEHAPTPRLVLAFKSWKPYEWDDSEPYREQVENALTRWAASAFSLLGGYSTNCVDALLSAWAPTKGFYHVEMVYAVPCTFVPDRPGSCEAPGCWGGVRPCHHLVFTATMAGNVLIKEFPSMLDPASWSFYEVHVTDLELYRMRVYMLLMLGAEYRVYNVMKYLFTGLSVCGISIGARKATDEYGGTVDEDTNIDIERTTRYYIRGPLVYPEWRRVASVFAETIYATKSDAERAQQRYDALIDAVSNATRGQGNAVAIDAVRSVAETDARLEPNVVGWRTVEQRHSDCRNEELVCASMLTALFEVVTAELCANHHEQQQRQCTAPGADGGMADSNDGHGSGRGGGGGAWILSEAAREELLSDENGADDGNDTDGSREDSEEARLLDTRGGRVRRDERKHAVTRGHVEVSVATVSGLLRKKCAIACDVVRRTRQGRWPFGRVPEDQHATVSDALKAEGLVVRKHWTCNEVVSAVLLFGPVCTALDPLRTLANNILMQVRSSGRLLRCNMSYSDVYHTDTSSEVFTLRVQRIIASTRRQNAQRIATTAGQQTQSPPTAPNGTNPGYERNATHKGPTNTRAAPIYVSRQ